MERITKKCCSLSPVYPTCLRDLPREMFGDLPERNVRCLDCRSWEGVYDAIIKDLGRRNIGKSWLPMDWKFMQALRKQMTKEILVEYRNAVDANMVVQHWETWRDRLHITALQFEKENRRRGLFDIHTQSAPTKTDIYLGAIFSKEKCRITEGYLYGITHHLINRFKQYNGDKPEHEYFAPLDSWHVGSRTLQIEIEIKRIYGRKEILRLPYYQCVELIEAKLAEHKINVERTRYGASWKGSVWSWQKVHNLLETHNVVMEDA